MALFKSALLTQASGSVGGLTFAHAAGGMYMRARAIPVQPLTPLQAAVKAALASLVSRWTDVLNQVDRDSWDLYAANVPQTNPLGTPFFQSGQNAYIQANTPRLFAAAAVFTGLAGLPLTGPVSLPIDTGPAIFDRGATGFINLNSAVAATQVIDFDFDSEQEWPNDDDTAFLVWLSRPRSPGRTFFRGPFRLLGAVLGDNAVPPVTPVTMTSAVPSYLFAAGEKIRLSAAIIRADGRYTSRFTSNDFVATA